MTRFLRRAAISLLLLTCRLPAQEQAQDLHAELEATRAEFRLPALTAMVMKDGRIVAQGAAGIRREGAPTPISLEDPVNIGSCTKWMTATVAGRLVDRKIIAWSTRVQDLLPANSFRKEFADATLEQLLAHRAGVEDGLTWEAKHSADLGKQAGSIEQVRRWCVDKALKDPPQVAPGTFLYSNQGYTVAALMLETAARKSWETLMQEEVFRPLGMKGAALGCSFRAEAGAPTGVNGHDRRDRNSSASLRAAPSDVYVRQYAGSNAPGGYVLCTLADWMRFLQVHVTGAPGYLQPATAAKLRTPFAGAEGYALGVTALPRSWAEPGLALTHNGDIFGEGCVFWMSPGRRLIVAVFTNVRSQDGSQWTALDNVAGLLINRFGK